MALVTGRFIKWNLRAIGAVRRCRPKGNLAGAASFLMGDKISRLSVSPGLTSWTNAACCLDWSFLPFNSRGPRVAPKGR